MKRRSRNGWLWITYLLVAGLCVILNHQNFLNQDYVTIVVNAVMFLIVGIILAQSLFLWDLGFRS